MVSVWKTCNLVGEIWNLYWISKNSLLLHSIHINYLTFIAIDLADKPNKSTPYRQTFTSLCSISQVIIVDGTVLVSENAKGDQYQWNRSILRKAKTCLWWQIILIFFWLMKPILWLFKLFHHLLSLRFPDMNLGQFMLKIPSSSWIDESVLIAPKSHLLNSKLWFGDWSLGSTNWNCHWSPLNEKPVY